MRYYRYSEDWVSYLEGEFRESLIATLRRLSFERFQKYPPPKLTGLPLGNEHRILSRFLRGASSQLDASGFSGVYRSLMNEEQRLIYRAFRTNDFLTDDQWAAIIGSDNIPSWISNRALVADANGHLQCQFSIVSLDGLAFAVEHLQDHGTPSEQHSIVDEPDSPSDEIRPFYHTYIGLDSQRMIEVMEKMALPTAGRYLDCGPGSGSLLLYFGRRFGEAVGVDINPRAAVLAQFNADLNALSNVTVHADDALSITDKYGRFDLVSWNLPFIFMPEEDKDKFIDGFGGELGIGLCLKFIATLPGLLAQDGVACVAALAPILQTGQNVLEEKLNEMLGRIGLDCEVRVEQLSLAHTRELWHFHQSRGLSKFESVYLRLEHGSGRLARIEAPFARRAVDRLREKMYARKFA
jgi:methylase of polypeptide subunit release factors